MDHPDSSPETTASLGWVVIDCRDPERLAEFWGAILDTEVGDRLGDPAQYVQVKETTLGSPRLVFQRVPEPKIGKNRLHLDISVDDVEGATRRIEALGGRRLADPDYHEYGYSWRRVADPEDNEFCVVFTRPAD